MTLHEELIGNASDLGLSSLCLEISKEWEKEKVKKGRIVDLLANHLLSGLFLSEPVVV